MQNFKIFYSWQSDLPGNKTRNFIRDCIDEAIDLAQESEAIESERDEATTGTTGSPNIVTTLFSKIDNCDLFIADISLCYSENQNGEKKSPNPNVLLELGYAVKTLGWERIICICNIDYGNKYPFDIAHNRITDYSLEGKNKKEVKNELSKIIFINIRELKKQPVRSKEGMAAHIIGTYDFETKKVINTLTAINISEQESYVLHNKEILYESRKLVKDIQELTNRMKAVQDGEEKSPIALRKSLNENHSQTLDAVLCSKSSEIPVVWKKKEDEKELIKFWLNIDVSDEFFDMGGLARIVQFPDSALKGTDDEKKKYEKLSELSYNLSFLEVRAGYLKTFEGLCFIPLAIQNISVKPDTDISVLVNVEVGEPIDVDENLICEEYEGMQGHLCRNDEEENDVGIICELFGLEEDGIIHVEELPYDPSRYIPKMPILTSRGLSQPDKTEEDYKVELEEFIASTDGKGYYEFTVAGLRPNECKWLCCGMLIRPVNSEIKVCYQIRSQYSMGTLSGVLEMN